MASIVQAFDKVTGQPIFTFKGGTTAVPRSVAGLWSSSTQAECQDSTGNVQVIYDRLDNAFVISRRVSYSEAVPISMPGASPQARAATCRAPARNGTPTSTRWPR